MLSARQQQRNSQVDRSAELGAQLIEHAKIDSLHETELDYYLSRFPNNLEYPEEALSWAASAGQQNALRILIIAGIDIHTKKDQPIRLAVANNKDESVRILLACALAAPAQAFRRDLISRLYQESLQSGFLEIAESLSEYLQDNNCLNSYIIQRLR